MYLYSLVLLLSFLKLTGLFSDQAVKCIYFQIKNTFLFQNLVMDHSGLVCHRDVLIYRLMRCVDR